MIHAALVWMSLGPVREARCAEAAAIEVMEVEVETPAKVDLGGGGNGHVSINLAVATLSKGEAITSSKDVGELTGVDDGNGNGIEIGDGAVISKIADVPVAPTPIVSKARPATLLHPTRQTDVAAAELFEAFVTVDTDGDVVGAKMVQMQPGPRGEMASELIFRFRYAPALDDDGHPIKSSFVQEFAVR